MQSVFGTPARERLRRVFLLSWGRVCPAIGWLVRWLWRWLGWSWVVVFVQRDDNDVAVLKPPDSIGLNTDGTVSVTMGYGDAGDALLTELRSLVG